MKIQVFIEEKKPENSNEISIFHRLCYKREIYYNMEQKWRQDYDTFKPDFESLQNEIYLFVGALIKEENTKIDVANIYKRPRIKSLQ